MSGVDGVSQKLSLLRAMCSDLLLNMYDAFPSAESARSLQDY